MTVLINTDVTLNGETITATVYEDADGDGTAENQQKFTVFDGVSDTAIHTLSGASSNTYWIRFDLSTSDSNTTPQVNSTSINTSPSSVAQSVTDVTLNNETVELAIYEDSDGDGKIDNQEIFRPADGKNTVATYAVGYDSSNTYWFRTDLSTADTTTSPELNSIEVQSDVQVIGAESAVISGSGENPSISPGTASINADQAGITATAESGTINPGTVSINADQAGITATAESGTINPGTASINAGAAVSNSTAENPSIVAGTISIPADAGSTSVESPNPSVKSGSAQIQAGEATVQITAQKSPGVIDTSRLSGTVTLNGSGVADAKIYCINDSNSELAAQTETDANGDYHVDVPTGNVYHMAVQYADGSGNKYNDESKPFLNT